MLGLGDSRLETERTIRLDLVEREALPGIDDLADETRAAADREDRLHHPVRDADANGSTAVLPLVRREKRGVPLATPENVEQRPGDVVVESALLRTLLLLVDRTRLLLHAAELGEHAAGAGVVAHDRGLVPPPVLVRERGRDELPPVDLLLPDLLPGQGGENLEPDAEVRDRVDSRAGRRELLEKQVDDSVRELLAALGVGEVRDEGHDLRGPSLHLVRVVRGVVVEDGDPPLLDVPPDLLQVLLDGALHRHGGETGPLWGPELPEAERLGSHRPRLLGHRLGAGERRPHGRAHLAAVDVSQRAFVT